MTTDRKKQYQTAYYLGHIEEWRQRNRSSYKERLEWIASQKAKPCMDCGGTFPPECMDFDHVYGEKAFTIGPRILKPLPELIEEISKCEIVCSNCHRIRTKLRANTTMMV